MCTPDHYNATQWTGVGLSAGGGLLLGAGVAEYIVGGVQKSKGLKLSEIRRTMPRLRQRWRSTGFRQVPRHG